MNVTPEQLLGLMSIVDEDLLKEIQKEAEGVMNDLLEYFSTPEKPVSATELLNFWESLSLDARMYYVSGEYKKDQARK